MTRQWLPRRFSTTRAAKAKVEVPEEQEGCSQPWDLPWVVLVFVVVAVFIIWVVDVIV